MFKITPRYAVSRTLLTLFVGVLLLPVSQAQSPASTNMAAMHDDMGMRPMMANMNEKMSTMKMTGIPDIDFAMAMRVHHQAAVQMADAELLNGKDPQMRVLAKDIIYAQKKEIAKFDKFLAMHGHAGEPKGK